MVTFSTRNFVGIKEGDQSAVGNVFVHNTVADPAPKISRRRFLGLSRAHPPLAEILNKGALRNFNKLDQVKVSYEKELLRNTEQVGSLSLTLGRQSYEVPLVFDISHGFKQITDKKNPDFSFLEDKDSLLNAMEIGCKTDAIVLNDKGCYTDPSGNKRECTEYGQTISLADISNLKQQILANDDALAAITDATELVLKKLLESK